MQGDWERGRPALKLLFSTRQGQIKQEILVFFGLRGSPDQQQLFKNSAYGHVGR